MFWCSKEPSHWDGSFEYPQHMFWMRFKKIIFSYALLCGGGGVLLSTFICFYLFSLYTASMLFHQPQCCIHIGFWFWTCTIGRQTKERRLRGLEVDFQQKIIYLKITIRWKKVKIDWTDLPVIQSYGPGHNKICLWEFPTKHDSNQSTQLQRLARILKFGL